MAIGGRFDALRIIWCEHSPFRCEVGLEVEVDVLSVCERLGDGAGDLLRIDGAESPLFA